MYSDIQFYIYRILYDKIWYPHREKIDDKMEEIMANIEDNVYVIKDWPWYKEQKIFINWNVFYYSYTDFEKNDVGIEQHVKHFWEYEYKIKWEKLFVRWLYVREEYTSTLCDWWSWDKIILKVNWWWDIWKHRSAWWKNTEEHIFKKENTKWWWGERKQTQFPKAKEIIMNHINGNKDLNSNYKEMLIPRAETERIAKEYLWNLDEVELHFSQLYRSKSEDYDFYLFHRKDAFKFDKKYVAIVSKDEDNNEYVLEFESDKLKKLFDKKNKKDGVEKSDFIRIRINRDYTASFELWNGESIDISNNIVKK